MKRIVAIAVVVFASMVSMAQQDPVKTLMKAKAGYAHRLLDAVVVGDFEAARDQAFRLKAVAETADWKIMETPEYLSESEEFIRATERLHAAARDSNLDAVALAYVDITLTCVQCHKHVRSRRAESPGRAKPD